jgi:nucleoside-diphosphate-sugar epimerase
MDGAFVTGGSGFIGGRLVGRLVADGVRVRALARSGAAADRVRTLGAEPVMGSLDDVGAMQAGAAGCEVAFHAAAQLGDWGKREEFVRGNVLGTRNAVGACAAAGVRRFVHVGTEAALIAGQPLIGVDEGEPLRPDSPALYSSTKALAEIEVRTAPVAMRTVVVRPRFVWGAGDTTLLPAFTAAVRAGRFAWIGGGRHLTATTHVDNVVEGLLAGARRGAHRAAYFVTDGDPVEFRGFVTRLLATQGLDAPERTVPAAVAGAIATAGEALWRALPLPGRPPLTRLAVWLASQECTLDTARAREELGYAPVRTRDEGLDELRAAAA